MPAADASAATLVSARPKTDTEIPTQLRSAQARDKTPKRSVPSPRTSRGIDTTTASRGVVSRPRFQSDVAVDRSCALRRGAGFNHSYLVALLPTAQRQ